MSFCWRLPTTQRTVPRFRILRSVCENGRDESRGFVTISSVFWKSHAVCDSLEVSVARNAPETRRVMKRKSRPFVGRRRLRICAYSRCDQ